ncbi:TPA: restriction endonuclease subunit S [Escherichia coli]
MVPKGWVATQIGDIAKISSGGTPSKQNANFWGGDKPWISGKDLKTHFIETSIDTLTDEGFQIAKRAPAGASLILVRGMTLLKDFPVGFAIREVAFNQDLKALVPNKNIDGLFLSFLLVSEKHKIKQLVSTAGHGTGRLDTESIKLYPINVPPITEQRKIAQILSAWDKAITVTEKLLTNSLQQKQALMQQLLTGKKRLLDENGVRFSGDWGKFTLSHFGKCIRGVSYKPENICEIESDNTIRLLRSTNIQNGELNDKDLIILPKKLVKPMQVLMDGDLAICMANGSKSLVGKSAPYKTNDADYTVGAFCALFRPLKTVSSGFVKFLFESNQYQSQLLVILAGSSINNLKGSDIESINIDAPLHYKEQQKIADVLSAADAEISVLEKKLACLKEEKKALMQQLLTGKRRVKVEMEETVSA